MREYQNKKNNPYLLPHCLYMRTLYIIRDYDRLKAETEQIIHESPLPSDGQPTAHNFNGSSTENKALRLAEIDAEIAAIETALSKLPVFYQLPIKNNILYDIRYPAGASSRTFKRYKQMFVFLVAKKLNFI